jgi:uncharacterized protein DUF1735
MNNILKYLAPSGLLCCILFSSCLKDTPYMNVSNTAPVITFGLSAASSYQLNNKLFLFAGDTAGGPVVDTAIGLVIASPQVLSEAVTVNFAVDPTQVAAFNTSFDSTYTIIPSNLYTLSATSVTIPAGHRVGRIPISINIPGFPAATHMLMLPLVIQSAKGASGDTLIVSPNSSTFLWRFERFQ